MRCHCGHELGEVTSRTSGLCPRCKRSIWMQVAMTETPDSVAIARELNHSDAKTCACTSWKTACFGFCGVLFENGEWVAITAERRRRWFLRLLKIPIVQVVRTPDG